MSTFAEERDRRDVAVTALRRLLLGEPRSREDLFAGPSKEAKRHTWQAKFLARLLDAGLILRSAQTSGRYVRYWKKPGANLQALIEDPGELTAYLWPVAQPEFPETETETPDEEPSTVVRPALSLAKTQPDADPRPANDDDSEDEPLTDRQLLEALLRFNGINVENLADMRSRISRIERVQEELLDLWKPSSKAEAK